MWLVRLTARVPSGETSQTIVRIFSNRWYDLLKNRHYEWGVLESMMKKGSLVKIEIDYKPSLSGVPRIEHDPEDGLFYLTIANSRIGKGYRERADAWASQEQLVR